MSPRLTAYQQLKESVEQLSPDFVAEYVASVLNDSVKRGAIRLKQPDSRVDGRYELDGNGREVSEPMREIGLAKTLLVGTDEGGYVTFTILTRRAERLHRRLERERYYNGTNISVEEPMLEVSPLESHDKKPAPIKHPIPSAGVR